MSVTIHTIIDSGYDSLADSLTNKLQSSDIGNQLVLVSSGSDERLLRSALQKRLKGLAPVIKVLSHQIAAWLKFGTPTDRRYLFLTPRERRIALSHWSDESGYHLNALALDRLQRLLTFIYRHGEDASLIPDFFDQYAIQIKSFITWCTSQSWLDRTALFLNVESVSSDVLGFSDIHIYLPGVLDNHHVKAIDSLMESSSDKINWHVYRPEGKIHLSGLKSDSDADEAEFGGKRIVSTFNATHVRDELEQVFGYIKSDMLDDATQNDFSDYVILATDYATYQPLIQIMEQRFDVPVSAAKGFLMIGDPAIARLRTYFYLAKNGFLIDHVVDVFADQVIPLFDVADDETKAPNLRTFSKLCKRYNLRTITQVEHELDRVLQREDERMKTIRNRFVRGNDEKEWQGFKELHGSFYRQIRDRLVKLCAEYPVVPQTVTSWYEWSVLMLDRIGVVKDASLSAAIRTMRQRIEKGLTMATRLDIDPIIDMDEFVETLDSLLDERLPISQHPGKVIFASIDDVTVVEGKSVFVVGLSDSMYPRYTEYEELFPGLEGMALRWLIDREQDPLSYARAQLSVLASQAKQLTVSYPLQIGSKRTMASPLLLDSKTHLPHWELAERDRLHPFGSLDRLDWILRSGVPHTSNSSIQVDKSQHAHPRLIASIARNRRDPEQISIWEGQLWDADDWGASVKAVVEDAWNNSKKNELITMSVSRLDDYSASPLDYFFKRVLRLEHPEEYNDEAEQNRKGDLLHAILEIFYSEDARFGALVDPLLEEDAARKRIHAIADHLFIERSEDLGYPDTPFPGILKEQIRATLDAFIETERNGLDQIHALWKGKIKPGSLWQVGENATEVPFVFDVDVDDVKVRINGFIDRLDRDMENTVHFIYDYKSGGEYSIKRFTRDMNQGLSFQLPVYLKAHVPDLDKKVVAGYYHINISKFGKGIKLKSMLGDAELIAIKNKTYNDFHGLMEPTTRKAFVDAVFERRVLPIIRSIRDGRFHQSLTTPSKYSDFSRMSRWSKSVSDLRNLSIPSRWPDPETVFGTFYIQSTVFDLGADAITDFDDGDE
jgi:ATP-dependent helicase/DNAse subunit B